ncbi:MAG: hypothetical protein WC023_01520 [Rhodocyclaceae bacterium]
MSDANTTGLDDAQALTLARDAYSGSTDYFDANVRSGIEKDIRRFQSRFPSDSKYMSDGYRARSRIFRPKTRATIRKNEAVAAEAFFSTLDMVSIAPADERNEQQVASADVMQALLQHRLSKTIPWFLTCIGAYQEAQVCGVVVSHQYWEFNAKKKLDRPRIELLPVENVRFSPAANWADPINTSPYVIHLMPMYVKDVKSRMRSGRWTSYGDAQILSALRNQDTTRMERDGNRTDATQQETAITDFTIVWVHQNIVEHDDEDLIFYSLGTELLLSSPAPLISEYAAGTRPFALGICAIEAHKNYPGGVSRIGAQIQDEINEVTNQRLDNVKFAMNKRYFVKRNKQVDLRSLTRNTPSSVTLMTDPGEDVKVVETNDVTASSYNEQDRLNMDYDDVAGVFSGSSVASNRKLNETVGGMNILTSNASQVTGYQLKTFVETWVEPVLRQLMLLEQHYETDEKILALAGTKAQLFQKFGIDAVTDELLSQELTLNVNVGMGATNPTDKINSLALGMGTIRTVLADNLLEKYGLQPQELIKEVLGALGHKDGGRFFRFENAEDPQIQSLMDQVQQLQQALNAKNPPEVIAAQVAKLREEAKKVAAERVESGVRSGYSAMQAAQVVATMPAVAPIADQLMQMAGYTPPDPLGVDPDIQAPAVAAAPAVDFPNSTNPLSPASPFTGAEGGIETPQADGVIAP